MFTAIQCVRAGDESKDKIVTTPPPETLAFRANGHEVELRAGAMFSVGNKDFRRPELDYAIGDIRYGWMVNDVSYSGFLRGNFELLLDAFGSGVITGPGNYMTGGRVLVRYNFVQPGWKLVPYVQIGGGGLYNDIYHQPAQQRIGQGFEFNLHAAAGVRLMITESWGLSLEGGYDHISNAGMATRNAGENAIGGTLGVNWFF